LNEIYQKQNKSKTHPNETCIHLQVPNVAKWNDIALKEPIIKIKLCKYEPRQFATQMQTSYKCI
jgi:hypothetical protein